jgi:hypothetical protein
MPTVEILKPSIVTFAYKQLKQYADLVNNPKLKEVFNDE